MTGVSLAAGLTDFDALTSGRKLLKSSTNLARLEFGEGGSTEPLEPPLLTGMIIASQRRQKCI